MIIHNMEYWIQIPHVFQQLYQHDGLSLFELSLKYRCPININSMMEQTTISYSPLMLELMLNKQLFPTFGYLT